jgi:hypothetical protein
MEQEQQPGFDEMVASVDACLRQGDKAGAVGLLHSLAIRYAEAGAFLKADAARERIFAVDPFALTEILTSGEAIEALRHKAICLQHKEVWVGLYSILTREEGITFYFSLRKELVQANQILFSQGTRNDSLYFVDYGSLKLLCRSKDKEEYLRSVRAGEIAGEDTFFQPQLASTTLLTDTAVTLHILERQALDRMAANSPALAEKIRNFCEKLGGKLEESYQKRGVERREYARFPLRGPITIQLIGREGQPQGGTFPGNISDISIGGLAMTIAALKQESSRLLLGRWLRVRFAISDGSGEEIVISQNALVAGLRFPKTYMLGGEHYTIRLSFAQPLDQTVIDLVRRGGAAAA